MSSFVAPERVIGAMVSRSARTLAGSTHYRRWVWSRRVVRTLGSARALGGSRASPSGGSAIRSRSI
ncbi:hypothetical protein FM103_06365 [Corynebacterium xerosis]|nr:hypothetical protein FM103_06365 [Corynebacterium xerosis]